MRTVERAYAWGTYLRVLLGTALAVIATVGAFNALVDPMRVFGAPAIPGVNAIKPYPEHHRELVRWVAANRVCPSAGIFGNSRAEIGFDPSHPQFERRGLSAFNYAIPGSSIYLAYRQLTWLESVGCMPRTIIVSVEFFDFLGGPGAGSLPTADSDPAPRVDLRFLAETVFSVAGLHDSLRTLMLQFADYPATLTERGFNPLYNYVPEVAQAGHYVLFRQRAEENVRSWQRKAAMSQPTAGIRSQDEQVLEAILELASAAGSQVHVVIYPYHAEIRMLMERLGMGDLFTEWKRRIATIGLRHADRGEAIAVWDFSGISQETLEAIPRRGDRQTRLRYYWEAGHFKKELGDRVIERIFGAPDDFGVRLAPDNIAGWLSEDRERVRAHLQRPSPLLAEVDDVIAQEGRK